MIRVLIVAAVPFVREGLRGLLTPQTDISVLRLPDAPGGLLENILSTRPDVVLLDVGLLEQEGWELLHELAQLAPGLHSVVVGEREDDRRAARALALGARGYLVRDALGENLPSAVRAAAQGFYILDPDIVRTALDGLAEEQFADESPRQVSPDGQVDTELLEPLTPRELQVLKQMVRGLSNRQIAAELVITEHTVKFHIRTILSKLGAANRTEAVALALQKGLISL